jgi:hypothetical protein
MENPMFWIDKYLLSLAELTHRHVIFFFVPIADKNRKIKL